MRIDAKIQQELQGISAKEAAELLCTEFYKGQYLFTYSLTDRVSTPQKLLEQKGIACICADEVSPICFYGGPPNQRKFYKGSLFTWLCDLILYAWATQGHYTDLVEYDDKLQTA